MNTSKIHLDSEVEGDNLYKEIKDNQNLLEAITEQGYATLLDSLGITDKNGKFDN